MRTSHRHALALILVAGIAGCTTMDSGPPPNPQSVIDRREGIMKGFAGALGAAANYTQGKGTAAEAKAKLTSARANAETLATLFPRGTALGDRGVNHSRALSTIFTNRSDFEAKADNLAQAFASLDTALSKGSKDETSKAAAGARNACSQCHNKYRAPED
jgi:cytochrome c556